MCLWTFIACGFRSYQASPCICLGRPSLLGEQPSLWSEERIWESRKGSEIHQQGVAQVVDGMSNPRSHCRVCFGSSVLLIVSPPGILPSFDGQANTCF
jgi:hypothetical protein